MEDVKEYAKRCSRRHRKVLGGCWEDGPMKKSWMEKDGVLCVQYQSGAVYHYSALVDFDAATDQDFLDLEWW